MNILPLIGILLLIVVMIIMNLKRTKSKFPKPDLTVPDPYGPKEEPKVTFNIPTKEELNAMTKQGLEKTILGLDNYIRTGYPNPSQAEAAVAAIEYAYDLLSKY